MSAVSRPVVRPHNPCFSSGPCAKRPGWQVAALDTAHLGRSHRAKAPKAALQQIIDDTRQLLGIPAAYHVGIVPASDTGAIEMAMWSLLGARGVDVLAWESFGADWVTDIVKQLKLSDVRTFKANYGQLPDLQAVDSNRDVVFCWNGTTSGVCVPDARWIADNRKGLTLCDATSAAFAMPLPWDKLDVTTFSWQKAMGGEAQHGMLVLSPRAVERLESYTPSWPLPKIFRLTKAGKFSTDIFSGATINTPSMLCVADMQDALDWGKRIGGLPALMQRSQQNLAAVSAWVAQTPWVDFLAENPQTRSCTSICLKIVDEWFVALSADAQADVPKKIAGMLEKEQIAFDINGYRDAPAGLRLWGGATVEASDMQALCPWLDWAYAQVRASFAAAA